MQYLSKAYNYYSGINPATLSGAIDVIVVRSVDEDTGEETLACSPFHVRFGKLQVLRPGEKRVTLRLPNNLPAPHIAPFSMKVMETGEAFFVLETDEDVPEDLLTSPVVMAADVATPSVHAKDEEPEDVSNGSLTNQPFGSTEAVVDHHGHNDGPELAEVEPLDLNEFEGKKPKGDSSDGKKANGDSLGAPTKHKRTGSNNPPVDQRPPNPLAAGPGEATDLPIRNSRLANIHSDEADVDLPRVSPGTHDGPDVVYGKDIILDAEGFHNQPDGKKAADAVTKLAVPEVKQGSELEDGVKDKQVDILVTDLMAVSSGADAPGVRPRKGSEGGERRSRRDSETLPSSIADLSLDAPFSTFTRTRSPPAPVRRNMRAQTEPPEDSRPSSPTLPGDAADPSQMDLAWDWGRPPADEDSGDAETPMPKRSQSLNVDSLSVQKPKAHIRCIVDDPQTFVLELDGRSHLFELSLCGVDDFAPDGHATPDEAEDFEDERITFERFMEDPALVDDPRLVVHYNDLYLTWKTGYYLLFALALYRRALKINDDKPVTPKAPAPSSGYFSRWWRRSDAPAATAQPIERTQSAQAALPDKGRDADGKLSTSPTDKALVVPPNASMPASEQPTRPASPTQPESDEEPEKHYAKTLRLTSDQLKELNLKPGPNTVQFSVMSSYSGYAVVTARLFLWESTDQVVISDIDGTITKSDALGHLYAAIGRDWTHIGIAKLYTDITNNGYKMLYLTARAIGQAETTREYLKTITQGDYRMPEGPVIMSPDRLMASLHREVILRKPELFKMACLRDIQRLFGVHAKDAFFAGFGNRITDAMSYRSVGIETGKIYTIDSTGVIKTELLQTSHKGSYVGLNDLVNMVFPPVDKKAQPEYTDFNYWRDPIPQFEIPDLVPTPVSPALSAVSEASGGSRLSRLLGLRSRSPTAELTSRPTSPLMGPAITSDDLSETEEEHQWLSNGHASGRASPSSMPGSFEDGAAFPEEWLERDRTSSGGDDEAIDDDELSEAGDGEQDDSFADDDAIFDDDILATGEMARVPF
ncbi:lipin Ned1 [Vanrija albida]|uniref:phosphatidate phosphatase n=1 Tax=Vanrija albida TaxID=181172 RepID=A0ABR3QCR2_9TREE